MLAENNNEVDIHEYISYARNIIDTEIKGIKCVKHNLGLDFIKVIDYLVATNCRLVIMGIGKSGIIGRKISSTLSSTGTPSIFIHPTEAFHGDFGKIEKSDTILLISNSGETEEILQLIAFFKNNNNKLVAMTGNTNSTLAKNCNWCISIAVPQEACPEQLAPTTSTTATLTLGDALSMTLMKCKNFKSKDFARLHPGGQLGRKLLTKASDLITKHPIPLVNSTDSLSKVIPIITAGRIGMCMFQDKKVTGVITDGDVRRIIEKNIADLNNIKNIKVRDIATVNPKSIHKDENFEIAEQTMQQHKITNLLVHDDDKNIIGVIQIYSLNN